jgi:hypothetical protein
MRIRRYLAASATALAAVVIVNPAAALAANGGDPDQGFPPCDQRSAGPIKSIGMTDPRNGHSIGTASLIYSSGCQTEWVKVTFNVPYSPQPSVWMQNRTGTDLYEANELVWPYGVRWTNQLSNMATTAACGGVQVYDESSGNYVGWYYIGCA